jgi:hypothetical protein
MPLLLARALETVIAREVNSLKQVTEAQAETRPADGKWSKKEELGHLIDSAVNNHVRFVRATLEERFIGPTYDQNGWVRVHGYQELPWRLVIDLWQLNNTALVTLIARIPEDQLETPCVIGDGDAVTLEFLIEDYIAHMQHHLDHILQSHFLPQ